MTADVFKKSRWSVVLAEGDDQTVGSRKVFPSLRGPYLLPLLPKFAIALLCLTCLTGCCDLPPIMVPTFKLVSGAYSAYSKTRFQWLRFQVSRSPVLVTYNLKNCVAALDCTVFASVQ